MNQFNRECLVIIVGRQINSSDVLYTLTDLFIRRCIPAHIRSDNGPEFFAKAVREWRETEHWNAVHRARQSLGAGGFLH